MSLQQLGWSGILAIALAASTGQTAQAQVYAWPAPVVSYYVPAAPVVSYYAPPIAYYTPPAVSLCTPVVPTVAAPVVFPGPVVSYYAPATVAVPATVSRGLFGRTIIRTPFSKTKF